MIADFVTLVVIPETSPYHGLPQADRILIRQNAMKHLKDTSDGLFADGLPPYPVSAAHPNVVTWSMPLELTSPPDLNQDRIREIVTQILDEKYSGELRIKAAPSQIVRYVIINGVEKCVHYDLLEDNYYSFGWALSSWHEYASDGQLIVVNFGVGLTW